MANNFKIMTAHSAVQLVGATDVQDVVEVWVQTSPSGVQYPLRIPDTSFSTAVASALASMYSAVVEGWIARPEVAAVGYAQELDALGNLRDVWQVVVTSTSGNSSRQVDVSFLQVLIPDIGPITIPIRQQLDALEGL